MTDYREEESPRPLPRAVVILTAVLCVIAVILSASKIVGGDTSLQWIFGAALGTVGMLACWGYVRAGT